MGWNSVPHYRPPAGSGETRLRVRAAKYYQASRLFDSLAMAQLYTPAKQLAEQQDLLKDGDKYLASFSLMDESNQASLRKAAQSITPESLDVELEGNWATTWGEYLLPTANSEITVKLDILVWVRSAGDWWIYTWTLPEIAAYGNPPDESYELLRSSKLEKSRQLAREMRQKQLQAEQPPESQETQDVDASPGGDSSQNQVGDTTGKSE